MDEVNQGRRVNNLLALDDHESPCWSETTTFVPTPPATAAEPAPVKISYQPQRLPKRFVSKSKLDRASRHRRSASVPDLFSDVAQQQRTPSSARLNHSRLLYSVVDYLARGASP